MSDHSGNSNDEYGPIASAWGDQTADPSSNDSETNAITGWRALSDPNAKIGPSGLGSGGLHRKGKNYKPVDEELILKHRKNGAGLGVGDKQIKQKNLGGATGVGGDKKHRFSGKKGSRSQEQQQYRQDGTRRTNTSNRSSTQSISQQSANPPTTIGKNNWNGHRQISRLSTERGQPPAVKSSWSNQSLVEKPFWETPSSRPSPSPPPSDNGLQSLWGLQYKAGKKPSSTAPEQLIETSWDVCSAADNRIQDDQTFAASQSSNAKRWAEWSSTKTSTDDGWQSNKEWQHSLEDGWGQAAKIATTTSIQPLQQSNSDKLQKKTAEEKGWITNDTITAVNANDDSGRKIPTTESQLTPPISATGSDCRFSNPRRPKYSQRNRTKPLPVNYRGNTPLTPPKEVAPPPPMDNPILVTINVELEEGNKIPVEIRLHDDPKQLASQFGRSHLVDSEGVILALCQLLQTQKNIAMKKRRRKPL